MKLKSLIALLIALVLCLYCTALAQDEETKELGLKDTLGAQTMWIGARPDASGMVPAMRVENAELVLREFNAIEPTQYPREGWPELNQYDFTKFNEWVNFGVAHGLPIVMHMVAGPDPYYPTWWKDLTPESLAQAYTKDEFEAMVRNYIIELLTSNNNYEKVSVWNVVNEPFTYGFNGTYHNDDEVLLNYLGWEEDRSGLTGSAKINETHPAYISICFDEMAKLAQGELELRDSEFEFDTSSRKYRGFYQLVKHLQNSDIKIDAVGLQGHIYREIMTLSYDYNEFYKVVQSFKDLGLSVYITELDIQPFINDEFHGKRYAEFFENCRLAGVDGVFFWGTADNEEAVWGGENNAMIFDESYQKKQPQYDMVFEALNKPLE